VTVLRVAIYIIIIGQFGCLCHDWAGLGWWPSWPRA